MRILLVEDDPLVSDAIVRGLATAGYVVDAVVDAESVQGRLDTTTTWRSWTLVYPAKMASRWCAACAATAARCRC
jgi:DNA-binding response OmpR family regulator